MVREQARYLATKDLVEKQTSIIENMKEKERDLVEKLKEHDASIEAEHAHIATLQETVQNFEVRLRKRNEELKEKTAECEALERINSLWMSQGKSDIQRQLEKMQAKWDKEKEELNRQWQQRVDEKDALLQILQLEVNRLTENMKDDDSE
jgi:peptidoglycan hydrolase CwlO-like protein